MPCPDSATSIRVVLTAAGMIMIRAASGAPADPQLAPQLQQSDGSWIADYVRLRFKMRKPA